MERNRALQELAVGIEGAVQASPKGPSELARLLHVHERTLRRYRRGERVPTRAWLLELERCCEVEPGSLTVLLDAVQAGTHPGPTPEDEEHPAPTPAPAAAPAGARPGRRPRRRTVIAGVSALCAAAIIVAVLLMRTGGQSSQVGTLAGSGVRGDRDHGRLFEWADNHLGSPVFAGPRGERVTGVPTRIPYGTRVFITCEVPNRSRAMSSVTAFYLVAEGRWKGDYVVSDTMSNGGPLGNVDSPDVDPAVPRCSR